MYFVNCKRIPKQGHSFCSSFCPFFFFDRSDKTLTCLKICLWNPGTYRQNIERLSSAQFGLAGLLSLVIYKSYKLLAI